MSDHNNGGTTGDHMQEMKQGISNIMVSSFSILIVHSGRRQAPTDVEEGEG